MANTNQTHDTKGMTTVKEVDCLEQDPDIRGQKYVCLSFLSPEDVILSRESFMFDKFTSNYSKEMNEMFAGLEMYFADNNSVTQSLRLVKERFRYIFDSSELQREYEFFKQQKTSELETEFQEKNGYATSVRGIKVRGVYDSIPEAKARVDTIRRFDKKFDVYVAEVGCWCPWSPYPEDLADQEYAETALNTLAKSYQENVTSRDVAYDDRKTDMTTTLQRELEAHKDAWMAAYEKTEAERAARRAAAAAKGDASEEDVSGDVAGPSEEGAGPSEEGVGPSEEGVGPSEPTASEDTVTATAATDDGAETQ